MTSFLSRLSALFAAALLIAATFVLPAQSVERRHGMSIFGELKYGPDFQHFAYVNPSAPKGGKISSIGGLAFDSFNPFILKGAPAAAITAFTFDSLMASADDEPASVYGLVAHSVEVADDKRSVTFYMRPEAKFADGSPITAADVAFTIEILRSKGHPGYRIALADVEKAEVIDPLTVRYTFRGDLIRDLPLLVAGLPILSKAYYDKIDFSRTSLVAPLGSGPYTLSDYKANSYITYRRRDDYWAKDLPVNKGRYNFDEIVLRYYKDRTAGFLGLTSGEYDLREEFTSKTWATDYNFPALADGRVKRETLPDATPSGTQGWFLNTRRAKFSDKRVRMALGLAFDFEWSNKNLFYGLYQRTTSYFENSPMKAVGKPTPGELALLEPHRAKLPKSVFGEVYVPPVSDASGRDRTLLRKAHVLLTEAGYKMQNGRRVNAKGEVLNVEFLRVESGFDRIIVPFINNLKALGIEASIRPVDSAQYETRLKSFDFDIIIQRYIMSKTPGVELRSYFSSKTADVSGSRNLAGIKDPVIDALIDEVMGAKSRAKLDDAVKAIDRVLRSGNYWVSHWFKASHNIAYWDKFSRPAVKPKFARGILDTWWYDAEKVKKLEAR
ncbi:MAG TPA: extracellular solute-binding protein [Hyphomicrobiaceae bacterium]|nr:extracellular solute-binding protein [Hyphomicrobiaceae bacterium]